MSVAIENMSAWARSIVDRLGLEAHPEGGWYTRDWQSPCEDRASGRPLASLIYFLLPEGDASAWHKVDADELWLWHGPAPVTLELGGSGEAPADANSERTRIILGSGITPRHDQFHDGDAYYGDAYYGDAYYGDAYYGDAYYGDARVDTQSSAQDNTQEPLRAVDFEEAAHSASKPVIGHAVVPAGVWQRTLPGEGDALVSCVVSPGFVFEGFTLE